MDPSKQNFCKFNNSDTSKKSLSLVIHPKPTTNICNIKISYNNSNVPLQDNVKYLGITIDSGLKFNLLIKTLEFKPAKSIGIISKLKQVLPLSTLRTLYYSTIRPRLLHDIVIWGSTFKTHLEKLSVLKNTVNALLLFGDFDCHSTANNSQCRLSAVSVESESMANPLRM